MARSSALRELQSRFYAAMMSGADGQACAELGESLTGEPPRQRRRLAAYRRNVLGNLCAALMTSYPVVTCVVGPAFFREAARHYIVAHPSESGDLNDYGATFPGFIADYPPAAELPYLADVAHLEWAVQTLRNAADVAPVNFTQLANIAPERYGDLRFAVDSRCVRLDSAWPIAEIWRVNQPDYTGDMAVDFSSAERVLAGIHRGPLSIDVLGIAAAVFFDALSAQLSLAEAAQAALNKDESFNFGPVLQTWIGSGLLRSASLAEP